MKKVVWNHVHVQFKLKITMSPRLKCFIHSTNSSHWSLSYKGHDLMEVIRGMWNGHEVLFCFQKIISECKRLESSMIDFQEDCFSTLPVVCRMNSKNMDHLHSFRVVKEYQYIKIIHVNQVQILLRHREFSLISAHLFPLTSGEKHPNVDLGSVSTQLLEASSFLSSLYRSRKNNITNANC